MDVYKGRGGGAVGVLGLLMVHMVLVYGKVSVRDGLLSYTIFPMILVMGLG